MSNFKLEKEHVLGEFRVSLSQGKIDKNIIPILNLINAHPDYYTTSSCSGRILLLALARPGAKHESKMLGKWHEMIDKDQLQDRIKNWREYPYLFFLAQSPIFHITSHNLQAAIHLRNLGDSAGFKYSSIRSIKQHKTKKSTEIIKKDENKEKYRKINDNYNFDMRITIELLSTERLNIPIGRNGKIFVDEEYIELMIEMANDSISDTELKIKKLLQILKNHLAVQ